MTGVDILSSQTMDDLFAIFNGVLLVIAIKYNIHTSASFFPRRDSYDLPVLIGKLSKSW